MTFTFTAVVKATAAKFNFSVDRLLISILINYFV
jgi:hypothetical protein